MFISKFPTKLTFHPLHYHASTSNHTQASRDLFAKRHKQTSNQRQADAQWHMWIQRKGC